MTNRGATGLTLSLSSDYPSSSSSLSSSLPGRSGTGRAETFRVGEYAAAKKAATRIVCDAEELEPHLHKPWLTDWLEERHGSDEPDDGTKLAIPLGSAWVEDEQLKRHTFLCGSSGYGKSRLAVHLAIEQLKAGCSVVALELKDQTVLHLLELARRAGFPAERVVPILPGYGCPPAWNPLDADALEMSADEAVKALFDVVRDTSEGWGQQIADVLRNSLRLAAAHRLSLLEVVRLLQSDDYRNGLLRREPEPGVLDPDSYEEVVAFFQDEFASMGPARRAEAAAPVLRRIREPVSDPFLRSLLCSRRPSFRLSSLWREPRLVLVHLDQQKLGEDGVSLVGTLLVRQLFLAAARSGGKGGNPVVLFLDEIGRLQKFLGDAPGDTLAFARSYDLRVIAACQFLTQLDPKLRKGLLANTAVQGFFRLEPEDAQAADWLAPLMANKEPAKLVLDADAKRTVTTSYPVTDAEDRPLLVSGAAKTLLTRLGSRASPSERLRALDNLLSFCRLPRPAKAADTSLSELVAGVPGSDWEFAVSASLDTTASANALALVVRFPRPKVRVLERGGEGESARKLRSRLTSLPVRRALLHLPGVSQPGEIETVSVPDAGTPDAAYLSAALSGGQSDAEVQACLAERKERIRQVAQTLVAPVAQEPAAGPDGTAPGKQTRGKPSRDNKAAVPVVASVPAVPEAEEDDSV